MEQKLGGKGFLKVCGILMIIGGGLGVITMFTTMGFLMALGLSFLAIFGIVGSALQLVTGILGVVHCNNASKAGLLLALGVVSLALLVVSSVILPMMYGTAINFVSIVTGAVLPVLFIIGALKNKNA